MTKLSPLQRAWGPAKVFLAYMSVPAISLGIGLALGDSFAAAEVVHPEEPNILAALAEPAPPDPTDPATAGDIELEPRSDHLVVKVGRVIVPVQKAGATSYVVTDFGISVANTELASTYRSASTKVRLRDAFLTALYDASRQSMMQETPIDTEALSGHLVDRLSRKFAGIDDVLILALYQANVPRR